MKIQSIASILVFCFSSIAFSTQVVTHVVAEDETAWFLAQVYYGSGLEFPKLLTSNQLKRAEDMKQGMEIRIENPKFFKQQSFFASRYIKLWEKRQKSLGLQVGSSLPHSKVVIPTEKIRTQDNTPKLPFAEINHSATSAADLGKEELVRELRTSDKGE